MDYSGTANNGTDENYRPDADAPQDGDGGGRPARRGLARYARPALIAGIAIAGICAALLVIIFFLDSFNATVYSVGGKDIADATDEAKDIRDNYAAVRAGGIAFLAAGTALAAAGALVIYRHRNERAAEDGEDVDFEDLGGRA
ncbi:hypothetical protein [Pseudarthrobacter sp. 1C304]|uniref:hypothetical protein n=1 Tax=Pseudarthrobacter sp. 1C304 TaxID=3457438 RepID=UPI003FD146D2